MDKIEEKKRSPANPMQESSEQGGEMENRHRWCREGKIGVFCWEVTKKRR
jgi:hypothetical protein